MPLLIHKQLILCNLAFCCALCLFQNCQSQKSLGTDLPCATKYPIILVHGILLRDDLHLIKYWSGIPKTLKKNGAKVYLANTNAFGSHVENALLLQDKIYKVLDETGAEKVNIIAHSKGGIESRYLIAKLEMADKVASLTTIATPHRGSYHADTIIGWLSQKTLLNRVFNLANAYGKLSGDKNPNALLATKELTIKYMENFNQSVPDLAKVYYQSYGSIVNQDYPNCLIRFQERLVNKIEGPSDGTVSLKSYQWGNFREIVKSDQDFGISHFDIVGMKFVSKQSTFDAEEFIVNIVKELKIIGF